MIYNCEKCNEDWEIIEQDYDFVEEDYPFVCPLCDMPIWEMIRDIWIQEKFAGIGYMLKIIKSKFKCTKHLKTK